MEEEMRQLEYALAASLSSKDFATAQIASTKAERGGDGHYAVELFPDGSYRVLWSNQIGNLYQTPGVILSVPGLEEPDAAWLADCTEDEWWVLALANESDDNAAAMKETLRVVGLTWREAGRSWK